MNSNVVVTVPEPTATVEVLPAAAVAEPTVTVVTPVTTPAAVLNEAVAAVIANATEAVVAAPNATVDTSADLADVSVPSIYLGSNWSHYFIFATAIFGLFWGVV